MTAGFTLFLLLTRGVKERVPPTLVFFDTKAAPPLELPLPPRLPLNLGAGVAGCASPCTVTAEGELSLVRVTAPLPRVLVTAPLPLVRETAAFPLVRVTAALPLVLVLSGLTLVN